MEPEDGILDWKGIRVYLRMKEYVTSGPQLDTYKSQVAKIVGEQAADVIKVLATFDVIEVRPLVDFGQGREKSIWEIISRFYLFVSNPFFVLVKIYIR